MAKGQERASEGTERATFPVDKDLLNVSDGTSVENGMSVKIYSFTGLYDMVFCGLRTHKKRLARPFW
jgi:hypothetical protein